MFELCTLRFGIVTFNESIQTLYPSAIQHIFEANVVYTHRSVPPTLRFA